MEKANMALIWVPDQEPAKVSPLPSFQNDLWLTEWFLMPFLKAQCLVFIFSSVQRISVHISSSVVSNSFWSQELQHARPPCPSPTPGGHPNLCPLSWWCHPTISSSAIPLSSCFQSFPASRFKWVSSSHQVAKILEFQLQHQSFQWTPRTDLF